MGDFDCCATAAPTPSDQTAAANRLAEAAAAFLAAWRRGEDETHALDEADDLDDALADWTRKNRRNP